MGVLVRPACLGDGIAVLDLLERVGYYPEPISFAQTFRKAMTDPKFLVRVAELNGRIVGVASLSMRHQLGVGGITASLDDLSILPDVPKSVQRGLLAATVGKARAMGARRIVTRANEGATERRSAPAPAVQAPAA